MRRVRYKFPCICGLLCALLLTSAARPVSAASDETGVRVQGSGARPQLTFACCEGSIERSQTMLATPQVIAALQQLHAQVAVALPDFTPERAAVVHGLNAEGIPAVAWLLLPKEQGYYFNADNAPAAASRIAAFEAWTSSEGLQWSAVGLDIEPSFAELSALSKHRWRLIATLLGRSVNGRRMERAREAYGALIRELERQGFVVQTYQMPYVPAERSVHSSLPDRWLGTVDVHGNEDYLMLYTSFARMAGAGIILSLGPGAQGIAVGSTDGDTSPGSGTGPLNWDEFSRDLIVASHFSKNIGVYDLEGCVRQGFLPRMETMDWSQSVVIPAEMVRKAGRMRRAIRVALWIASHIVYLSVVVVATIWLVVRWWRSRRRARQHRVAQS
jgi:hypothetical protein